MIDIVVALRILLSPPLGPSRTALADRFSPWRRALHYLPWIGPIAWLCGGVWLRGAFVLCYARELAISATIVLGVPLIVAIVTAANQIGRRGVR